MTTKRRRSNSKPQDAFFTIVTPSHFGHAKSLMTSVRSSNPRAKCLIVLLGNGVPTKDLQSKDFEVLQFNDWAKADPQLIELAGRYTAFQLCCALKPYAAGKIFETLNVTRLVYLDSDILVFSSMRFVFDLLAAHSFILTPHLTDPDKHLDDGLDPNEFRILTSGVFNLGFFAVSKTEAGRHILDWWWERTKYRCEQNLDRGLYDDQRWMNLVPGLFPEAHVLRHPGCNVAYWNIHEDRLTQKKSKLVFYHYSGWFARWPNQISVFQNRYYLSDNPQLKSLLERYLQSLLAHSVPAYRALPYQFDVLKSGKKRK